MKVKISFKHLEHTPALDARIEEKSARFAKFFEKKCDVSWVCWVEEGIHYAELKVLGPQFECFAKAHAEDLYKCLDLAAEKAERQVEKYKEKRRNRVHQLHSTKRDHVDHVETFVPESDFTRKAV